MFFTLSLSTDRYSFSVENHYISSSAIPAALISSLLKNLRFIIKHPEIGCSSLPISLLVPYAPIPLNHTILIVQKIFTAFVTNTDLTTLNSENMMLLKHFHKSFRKRILQLSTSTFSANASHPYPLITSSTVSELPSSSSIHFVAPEAVSEGLLESLELETMAWTFDSFASPEAVSPFTYLAKYEDPFEEDPLLIADPLLPQMPDPLASDSSPFDLYETLLVEPSSSPYHHSLKASDEEELMVYSNNSDEEEMIVAPPPAIEIGAIAPKKPTKRPRTQISESEDSSPHKRPRIQAPLAPLPSTSIHKQVKSKIEPTPTLTKKRTYTPEQPHPFFSLKHGKKTYSIQQKLCYPFISSRAVSSPVLPLVESLFFRLKSIFKYVDKSIEKKTSFSLLVPKTLLPLDFPETPSNIPFSSNNPLFYWSLATLFLYAQEALEKCYDQIPSSGCVTNSRTVRLTKINNYIAKCKQAYENLGGQIPWPSHRSNPLFSSSPFITDSTVDASIPTLPKQKKASHKTALLPTTQGSPTELSMLFTSNVRCPKQPEEEPVWKKMPFFYLEQRSRIPSIKTLNIIPFQKQSKRSLLSGLLERAFTYVRKAREFTQATFQHTTEDSDLSIMVPEALLPSNYTYSHSQPYHSISYSSPLFYWSLYTFFSYSMGVIDFCYKNHLAHPEILSAQRVRKLTENFLKNEQQEIYASILKCKTAFTQSLGDSPYPLLKENPLLPYDEPIASSSVSQTTEKTPKPISQMSFPFLEDLTTKKSPSAQQVPLPFLRSNSSEKDCSSPAVETEKISPSPEAIQIPLKAKEIWGPILIFIINDASKQSDIRISSCWPTRSEQPPISPHPAASVLTAAAKKTSCLIKKIETLLKTRSPNNSLQLPPELFAFPVFKKQSIIYREHPLFYWLLACTLYYTKDAIEKFYTNHIPSCEQIHVAYTNMVKQTHQIRMEKISATIRLCQTIHQQLHPKQLWLAFPGNPLITQIPHCLHCQYLIDPTTSTLKLPSTITPSHTRDLSSPSSPYGAFLAATLRHQNNEQVKATLQTIRAQQSLPRSIRQHVVLPVDKPQPICIFSIDCHSKIPKIKILDCKPQIKRYKNPSKNISILSLSPLLEVSFIRIKQTMAIIRKRFLNASTTHAMALTVPSYMLPIQHLTQKESIQLSYNNPLLGWVLIILLNYSKDAMNTFYETHKDTFKDKTHCSQIARNHAIDACIAECYAKYPHLQKDDPTLTAQPNILIASKSFPAAEAPSSSTSSTSSTSSSKTSSMQQPLQDE